MSRIELKKLVEKMNICYKTGLMMVKNNKIPNAYQEGNLKIWYVNDYEIFLEKYLLEKENKYNRICEKCGKISKFKKPYLAKKSKICHSCSLKEKFKDPIFYNKILNNNRKLGETQRGENNPFSGKKHSKETLEKIKKSRKENIKYQEYIKSDEFKEKMSNVTSGIHNPMYGKKVFNIWVEKYGIEEATQKIKNKSKEHSLHMSGKNNPMYGKPSPHGSGKGLSGWYKTFFFRSLHELTYIIKYLDQPNIIWESAETKDLTINYIDYNGIARTYKADFFVNNCKLIEVKPTKLINTPLNKLKKDAAEKFCKIHNYTYEICDPEIIEFEKIKELYLNGTISFTKNSEIRFKTLILN